MSIQTLIFFLALIILICTGTLSLILWLGFKRLTNECLLLAQPLTRLADSYTRVAAIEEGKQAWYKERQRLRRSPPRDQYQNRTSNYHQRRYDGDSQKD